jgi:hypothetical protein
MGKNVHIRLTLDINISPGEESIPSLINRIDSIPAWLAGEGQFTGDSTALVDTWSHKTEQIIS